MGGVESSFHFIGYKIDRIQYSTHPSLGVLAFAGGTGLDVDFKFGFRRPIYFEKEKTYLNGIDVNFSLLSNGEVAPKGLIFCKGTIGIAGTFAVVGEPFPPGVEEQLVKIQIPTILLPYIRASISSLLANAGFGSVIFPLINMPKMADEAQKVISIQRFSSTESLEEPAKPQEK